MPPKTRSKTVLVLRTEEVALLSLQMYHKNPRVGNVELIARSLEKNQQFKPIVVNIGSKTGRPNEIAAGNHTYLGARRLGWKTIYASFIDVDEETLTAIVLADNKTSDAGTYDETILAELLANLPDITGTGYNQAEIDKLLTQVETQVQASIDSANEFVDQQKEAEAALKRSESFEGAPLGGEPDPGMEPVPEYQAPPAANKEIGNASEQMPGMLKLKDSADVTFPGIEPWGIPKLLDDMLMTWDDLPEKLDSWGGSATKNWPDPDQWWLYNWGVDSTSGMHDVSKVIVSFYCYDAYFENWWTYPDRYVTKILNSNIKYILTPNFSQNTDFPKVESLYQLYRARWIGRYCQEAGLKVLPDVTWRDGDIDWLTDYVLATLPKGLPMIAMQLQTIDPEQVTGGMEHFKDQVRTVFDVLQPESALIYAGTQGREMMDELCPKNVQYRVIGTRYEKLSAAAKSRQKKTTI